jgi:hypothetical protein
MQGLWLIVHGLGFRIFGFWVHGLGISGFRLRVSGLEFRDWV